MKKTLFTTLILFITSGVYAQHIQTHYDFGKDRQMLTTTLEMFKADAYGSSFFFVDFEYGSKTSNVDGVSLAYMEIARELKFWDPPVAIRAEYDGGLFRTSEFSAPINSAYLLGGSYTFSNSTFSKMLNLQAMYKYIEDKHDASFQITAVWALHFFDRKLSFNGFADFWREDNVVFDNNGNASSTNFVFLTEPQLWYNFTKHFSAGSEIEISSNFSANKGFKVNPTLGLKWFF
ncbi:DUF5020 family protein [Fodinibius sp. Rm-B-1B1-1]|uniref:DUF5020 family protein n=1 Tax=Fodinibius alkaliphilus TaxID=3140241 RepID=UPI00315ABE56